MTEGTFLSQIRGDAVKPRGAAVRGNRAVADAVGGHAAAGMLLMIGYSRTIPSKEPTMSLDPSRHAEISDAEREARIALAACYRLAAHYRMTDLIYTHITARVPGRKGTS